MSITSPSYKISFERLLHFFQKTYEEDLSLTPALGNGFVRIYKIEKGLQARIWDCCFHQTVEIYRAPLPANSYSTLAFFPNLQPLSLTAGTASMNGNTGW